MTGEGRLLSRILEFVLGGANVDFSEYKKTTVLRRIARRMQNAGMRNLVDYLEEIERNPAEARALANDLLIVVTEFFRDPGVWELIAEKVLPDLLTDPAEDRPIRIWVPAVATGQEAYSIAMLLREAADQMGREPRVQIFATDVNPLALEKAAAGLYTEQEMANVSPARREAFFAQNEDGLWQVGPEIRNWIVFAPHNMLRDPPFINTDLISCRNALIYLETRRSRRRCRCSSSASPPMASCCSGRANPSARITAASSRSTRNGGCSASASSTGARPAWSAT
jgi:two-component system CheB/CheR fusion protein